MPRKHPERRIPESAGLFLVPREKGRGFKPLKTDDDEFVRKTGISVVLEPAGRFKEATPVLERGLRKSGFDAKAIGRPIVRVVGMFDALSTIETRADSSRDDDTRTNRHGKAGPLNEYDFQEAISMIRDVRQEWVSATRPRKRSRAQFQVGAIIPRVEQLPFSGDDAMMVGPRIGEANSEPDVIFSLADPMSLMAEVTGSKHLVSSDAIQRPMLPLVRVMGDSSGIDEAIASLHNTGELVMPRYTAFELNTRVVTIG